MRRTQIYLDDQLTSDLDERARAAGRSRSDLIRDAVRRYLGRDSRSETERIEAFRGAARAAAGGEPGLEESVDELRRSDSQRQQSLERRWRDE